MEISSNAKLLIIGKTKVYIVPPPPISREEYKRRIEEVKAAGCAILRGMMEKKKLV